MRDVSIGTDVGQILMGLSSLHTEGTMIETQ